MRIVIVSDPYRKDFYNYIIDNLVGEHELFILWDYKKEKQHDRTVHGEVKFLYWKDYLTPKIFLDKIKPDRVIFFEIIDFWQMPLIIACHQYRVTSFFVEHGVGNNVEMVVARFNEMLPLKSRLLFYSKKLGSTFLRVLRNRIFFLSAAGYLDKKDRLKYLKLLLYYKKFTPIHALSLLKFRRRTPHFAILFNKNNISPFRFYNDIETENIISEGVPFYDKFHLLNLSGQEHLFFIDHPYLEFNLLGWDDNFHERIARALESFAVERQVKIIVKLHPKSNLKNWERYNLHPLIDLKQHEDVTKEMLSAKLILGYSSTLISVMILCKKNIVLLGWHPEPKISGEDFSKTGLCHVSYTPNDLPEKYNNWLCRNLTEQNDAALYAFQQEYSYPFDGKATQRVIRTILQNDVS